MNENSPDSISQQLENTRAPAKFGLIGFAIIVLAYLLALVNFFLPTPIAFIQSTLQPMIFVGLGSLLYHIGQHVHALHENVIRMALMQRTTDKAAPDKHG